MSSNNESFGSLPDRRDRAIAAGSLLVGSLFSSIGAAYPRNTGLQVGPVVLLALFIPWLMQRLNLSKRSWRCLIVFLLLHLLAAHWTYSDVPYRDWFTAIGIDAASLSGQRNMFDRLVHFSFGLLIVRPVIELETIYARANRRLAMRLAILFVLASSAAYEIFEWTLAIMVSPESAEAYNGQQGDMFDAQKDMWLALLGAILRCH